MNQPIDPGSGFDPLNPAGSGLSRSASSTLDASAHRYVSGQLVEASMENTTFFRRIPKGDATADHVLAAGTPLQVVSTQGTYVKVRLDSGEVGFIPEMMVIDRNAAGEVPIIPVLDPSVVEDPNFMNIAPPPEIPGISTEEEAAEMGVPAPDVPAPSEVGAPEAAAMDAAPAASTPAPEPEIPSLEGDTPPPPPTVPSIAPVEDAPAE